MSTEKYNTVKPLLGEKGIILGDNRSLYRSVVEILFAKMTGIFSIFKKNPRIIGIPAVA